MLKVRLKKRLWSLRKTFSMNSIFNPALCIDVYVVYEGMKHMAALLLCIAHIRISKDVPRLIKKLE